MSVRLPTSFRLRWENVSVSLGWQGWLTIGVVLATLGMLLWARFRPHWILLGAMAVLAGSGILMAGQALAGFWNRGVLTVAAAVLMFPIGLEAAQQLVVDPYPSSSR